MGGGKEARRIPGRGEEDDDRDQKLQGGADMDKAQHRQEEEKGNSVGGRDQDGVKGAGSELGSDSGRRQPGTGQPLGGCHPKTFRWGGGVSSPAPRQLPRTQGR